MTAHGGKRVCHTLVDRRYNDNERWALHQEWLEGGKYCLSNRKAAAVLFDVALGSFEWEVPF